MDPDWNDSQPIYLQVRDRIVTMMLDGLLQEGEPLPSVRSLAADAHINPITVSKGYQHLVDEGLVEKRRGRGMFVAADARARLLTREREKFLQEEWPAVVARIRRLGLQPRELLTSLETRG